MSSVIKTKVIALLVLLAQLKKVINTSEVNCFDHNS